MSDTKIIRADLDEIVEAITENISMMSGCEYCEHEVDVDDIRTALERFVVVEEVNNLTKDSGQIINLPKRIYLQVGYENIPESDLNESGQLDFTSLDHEFTTWCQDRIEKTDPCYIHSSEVESLRTELERLKQCEAIVNSLSMVSHICLPQANPHIVDIIDTARQWVKDNPTPHTGR